MGRALYTIVLIMVFNPDICAQPETSFNTIDSLYCLNIPDRPEDAIGASEFAARVSGFCTKNRENAVIREILSGNIPKFSRTLKPIKISQIVNGKIYELVFFVACDYLAIGSEEDYLYMPLTPITAQYLADTLDCTLPTEKIVDEIYVNSETTLVPQPIPPSDTMTTMPVFVQHSDSIKEQFSLRGIDRSANRLVAGHKKDIIISNKIYSPERRSERVVIYGWHLSENNPIQPVYDGHTAMWADYSHGVRLISDFALLNGAPIHLEAILSDPVLSILLSSEGVIGKPYYPTKSRSLQE